jgi:predicted amidohydrolase YtcJ
MIADMIIKSRAVFDGIADAPFQGYVAIKGNKISAVGRGNASADGLADAKTEVIDAGERLVMPGFHDSHVHLLMAGLYRCYPNLTDARSEEEAARMVADAAEKNPNKDGFMFGFGWYHFFWDSKKPPRKESLDRYFPDRPVLLVNAEAHGVWVNSKALAIAGITEYTKDPFGGKIERDESGEATGFLYENASGLVTRHAFVFSKEREAELLRAFMDGAAAYGITSVNDVMPYFHGNMGSVAAYSALDAKGGLTVRIHAAPNLFGDLDEVVEWRNKYSSEKLRVNMVKQFLDGVSTTHTALLLDDYANSPGDKGSSLFKLDEIEKAVPEAHRRGLSVKLHSCGDASLRLALDCYENAIKAYGNTGARHAAEHCEMVSDTDMPRFGALGVIPSVQPEHVAMTQIFAENPYHATLGKERADKTWPFKSLLESAGVLAIGSDCPVVDNNPFLGIYRAVTRLHNDGEPAGGWNPSQKLTLSEILKCYTWGSAYGVSREDELGTLAPGRFADIAVLSQNPFVTEESKLIKGTVDITVMDGRVIYER